MTTRMATWMTVLTATALLALPGRMVAQQHRSAPYPYTLIDLGTLGGPQSGISGPNVRILNNSGMVGGQADTTQPDTDAQITNPTQNADPSIQHAVLWRNGVPTDLGALPGANSADFNWINARGDAVGQSENGLIDPHTGLTAVNAVQWTDGRIHNLGTLPGGYESLPTALNDRGQTVGFSTNAVPDAFCGFIGCWKAQTRAVLWTGESIQDLGTLGGPDSVANYVNNRGQIAGASYTNATVNPGTGEPTLDPFLWEHGHMLDLGTLGGAFGYPHDMNNHGQVVGQMNLAGDQTHHGFLWGQGQLTDLGTLGGDNSEAMWLNDAGAVVGRADLPGSQTHHAFLWTNGTMTDLGTLPGQTCSTAYAVNALDQAVGDTAICGVGEGDPFLWTHGSLFDLQVLVAPTALHLTDAWDINARGEIAGMATLPNNGGAHAVLLIPTAAHDGEGDATGGDNKGANDDRTLASMDGQPMSTTVRPAATGHGG